MTEIGFDESSLRVTATIPVTDTETVETLEQPDEYGDRRSLAKRTKEYTVSISYKIEGTREVAEALLEFLDPQNRDIGHVQRVLGTHGEDSWLFDKSIQHQDAEIGLQLTCGIPAVYRAAFAHAKRATRRDMCRRGISPERVIYSWSAGGGYGYPDDDSVLSFTGDGLTMSARRILFGYFLDQTPGRELGDVPEPTRSEMMEYRRNREDLYE